MSLQMLKNFDRNTREGKCACCPARERYIQEYEHEIRLNEEFDGFVAYFQQAYEGPNTAHAQTGSKYDTRRWSCVTMEISNPLLGLQPTVREMSVSLSVLPSR